MKANLLKTMVASVGLFAAPIFSQSVWAADPDLSNYTVVKTMDFTTSTYSSDTKITLDNSSQQGTAYETGNKLQQKIFDVATPEDLTGYLAFQAVYGSKGWWIRSTKGGLYSISAPRSAAVLNCKEGYVVAFNCTQDAGNVITLTNANGEPDGPFTYEKSEDTKTYYATLTADGQVGFCGGKNAGYITSIVIYAPGTVVLQPTAAYTAVNGVERTVKFTGANLAYNTDGSGNYTLFKDGDGNNVNTAEVTVSDTTTYYVVSTNGDEKSEPLKFTIEAGSELSLATPTYSIATMGEGFTKTYSVACDNSGVLLKPTAKLSYSFVPSADGTAEDGVEFDGTINTTEAGVYTVTASADGYVPTTITIDNTTEYELAKTIDFTALTADDLSSNWTLKNAGGSLPGSSSQWLASYSDVVADEYYYNFSSETASSTDIIDGLDVEFSKDGKTPKLYTGFGFMYPIYQQNADGTDNTDNKVAITSGKIAVANGTADQIAVYSYINNYGKGGTKTSVVAGDESFSLYRFSDMLTKVEIYSPKTVAPENVVEHFSGLMNLADGSEVTIKTTDAVITATGYAGFGMSVYVQDGTGAVKLSNDLGMSLSGMGLGTGSKVVGTIYAVYSAADGTPTLGLSDKTGESVIDMAAGDSIVAPIEMTIAEAKQTENLSKYVEVKNAKMFGDISDMLYIAQGTDTIQVYDQFWALPEDWSETPDSINYIKGIVVLHEGVPTIYPYGDDAISTKGEVVDPTVEVEGIGGLAYVDPYSDVKLTLTNAKVTVVSQAGRAITAYVEDETGALEFGEIAEALGLKAGMTISGTIYATYDYTMAGMSLMANENTAEQSSLDIVDGEAVAKATTIAEVKDENNINRFVSFTNVNMTYDEKLGQIYMTQGTDTIIIYNAFDVFEWDEEYNLIVPASVSYTEGILGTSDDVFIFSPTKVVAQTNGINAAAKASAKVNAAVYTINGTMVRKAGESLNGLAKGVYIVGGKKVVIK